VRWLILIISPNINDCYDRQLWIEVLWITLTLTFKLDNSFTVSIGLYARYVMLCYGLAYIETSNISPLTIVRKISGKIWSAYDIIGLYSQKLAKINEVKMNDRLWHENRSWVFPPFLPGSETLQFVSQFCYIASQLTNMLISRFKKCSTRIKTKLFRLYCLYACMTLIGSIYGITTL